MKIQNPWQTFELWYEEAKKQDLLHANAFTLSTANKSAKVTSRTLLLKEFSQEAGFIFYTNLNSRKGKNILENPFVSMLFYWDKLQRQVKIEGQCSILSEQKTEAYFQQRPRESQLGAWSSNQSQAIHSREELLEKYHYYEKKFENKKIPLPPYWRGIAVKPLQIEFWQGEKFRMHQRIRFFFKKDGSWTFKILSP